jgi:hypothetical protein
MSRKPEGNWHLISIKPLESNEICRFCNHGEYWHRESVRSIHPCTYGNDGAVRCSSPGELDIFVPGSTEGLCGCLDFVPTENLKYLEHTLKRIKQ